MPLRSTSSSPSSFLRRSGSRPISLRQSWWRLRMGSMDGAAPLTASSPSLNNSSVTPRNALAMTSGFLGSRPLTISRTWRIFSELATELPPNFMTIIGGTLEPNGYEESRLGSAEGAQRDRRRQLSVHVDPVEDLDLGQHDAPALAAVAGDAHVAALGGLFEEDAVGEGQTAARRKLLELKAFLLLPGHEVGGGIEDLFEPDG